ncbi:hypothetical protein N7481_003410 [Penicillium waksmanii]|uniref:uncharacterized protein n=1 Tax=Penicillium waksmanii TaxID=69791 RepID=UPI00254747F5|nr:uncharacterized protein N7481_003410 [Penicillium waksmanii]KAJ5988200.1 hypothetical protein N7481_003410 [Penicillium waksmanii]
MATSISYGEKNSGFQAGVVHGNIGNVTIVQSETLDQACLRDLRTTDPIDDKERIKDTKGGLLEGSYRWIFDNKEFRQWQDSQKNRLLWIRGDPGKGKTMLLCGVTEELTRLYGDNASILFFFCQATDIRINSATSVLRGLIYLLVKKHPSLLYHVRARYDYAGKTLFEDVNAWNALSTIFRHILNDPILQMTYLVIDALDECTNGLYFLLDFIVQESSVNTQIKWVVSSRNWPEITERLDIATQLAPISLELNEISVSGAVNYFIHHKVQELAKAKREILAIISTVFRPITLYELSSLIEQPDDYDDDHVPLEEMIVICGSFLTLREHTNVFVHQSAKEFLLKEALSEILPRGIEAEHKMIFTRSFDVIFKELQRDILNIKLPGLHVKDIHKSSSDPLAAAAYACVYWMDHLQESGRNGAPELSVDEKNRVDTFLQEKFLQWLEALSILGSVSDGIQAMQKLQVLIEDEGPDWVLNDPLREESWSQCLQTLEGHSDQVISIVWSPDGRQLASGSSDNTVRIWDPATGQSISTLYGHSASVRLIAWSPDGNQLASGSRDKTVRIWDPATSQNISTLDRHSGPVNSIAWSPDGNRLASASGDKTVRIWDPATGQNISTLDRHSGPVNSIAWSPDRSRLASASDDKTVRIWDPATGQSISTLEGHSSLVTSIAWSPDGSRLVSVSGDKTVRIWDPATGHSISIIKGHNRLVGLIAWSLDGRQLASGSSDNTVRIWDPATSQSISTLEGHSSLVTSIAWSPVGSRLVSASGDKTVRIWDPATGQSISTLEGHSNPVYSVSWSPDGSRLASASMDKTVRIWDPATGQSISTLDRHRIVVYSIAWSPDGSRLASASVDETVRIWDPTTGRSILTLKGHSSRVNSIAWSPDGSRLASGSSDNTVRIWDPATGQSISTLNGHSDLVDSIAWSPDGNQLASGSRDKTVRIWDPATGQSISTLEGHSSLVTSIAWSRDGSRLASASYDETVRIWDLTTGQSISTLEGHSSLVYSIAWSPDGSRLASASVDKTVRIWDLTTGQSISTLCFGFIGSVQFDKDDLNRLHTDSGTYGMDSINPLTPMVDDFTSPLRQYGYGLSKDYSWLIQPSLIITTDAAQLIFVFEAHFFSHRFN